MELQNGTVLCRELAAGFKNFYQKMEEKNVFGERET